MTRSLIPPRRSHTARLPLSPRSQVRPLAVRALRAPQALALLLALGAIAVPTPPAQAQAATAAGVTFTSLASLRPAGDDVVSVDGTVGWPGARYPTAPPLYAVRPGATTGTLYGGFSGQGLLGTRKSIYTSVGLFSMAAGVSVYERLAYDDATDLQGRVSSTPVRASDGALYAVMTSEYGHKYAGTGRASESTYSATVGQGLIIRTDFDGTYPTPVAATAGKLYTPNGALVIDSQDNLYGVDRGPRDQGRIFKVSLRTGTLTTVHEFSAGPNGMRQVANDLVLSSDGRLYGVTGYDRGLSGHPATPAAADTPTGTVFSIDPANPASFTLLHRFTLAEGEINVGDNASSDSFVFYPSGRYVEIGQGGEAVLKSIGSGAQSSLASLTDGGDGYLYGATSIGDCHVYALPNAALNLRRIDRESPLCGYRSWAAGTPSIYPRPYPYHDAIKPYGTLYRIAKAGGPLQVLHTFKESDGATPRGPMALGADGAIYGTTLGGGPNLCGPANQANATTGCGTIYRIHRAAIQVDAAGQVTNGGFELVHAFAGNDGNLPLGVRTAADGRLYGVTSRGGSYRDSAGKVIPTEFGTVFQLAPASAETPTAQASLVAAPVQIAAGQTATLTWTSTNTANCTAASTGAANSGGLWTGAVAGAGSVTFTPAAGTYRYTLTCNVAGTSSGAQVSATTTVYVSTPATAEDGNAVSYGNGGGALSPLSLAPLALAVLGLRRRRARRDEDG